MPIPNLTMAILKYINNIDKLLEYTYQRLINAADAY